MVRNKQGSDSGAAAVIDLGARRKQEEERRLQIEQSLEREREEIESEDEEQEEQRASDMPRGNGESELENQSGGLPPDSYPVTRLEPGRLPQVLSPEETPNKREHLASLLDAGKVQIRLDPRRAAVEIPEHFRDDAVLALNLSWRFPNTHMLINERGVAATLRFAGVPFRCQIPWHAIWGIAPPESDWLVVWTGDLPAEFGGPGDRSTDAATPVEPGAPRLSVLSLGEESSESSSASSTDELASGRSAESVDAASEAGVPAEVKGSDKTQEDSRPGATSGEARGRSVLRLVR